MLVNLPVHTAMAASAAATHGAHMLTEMSERFYVSFPLTAGPVELEGAEAHHLANVSRVRAGERVILFNGDGNEYNAVVQHVAKKRVALTVDDVARPQRERGFRLQMAVPLPKGDRGQFLVEKLTELGVTTYTPLQTSRSVVHPSDSKVEKLKRYVVEASKQCGRNTLMSVSPLAKWTSFAMENRDSSLKWIAHRAGDSLADLRNDSEIRDLTIAIGPEGGWTDEEVELAREHQWRVVELGPRTLRVETAAIVMAALAGQGK